MCLGLPPGFQLLRSHMGNWTYAPSKRGRAVGVRTLGEAATAPST